MPAIKSRLTTRKAPTRRRVSYSSDPRKVLIAVDASRPSNAAVRFARRMAQLNLWAPQAVTVAQPLPAYIGDFVLQPSPIGDDAMRNGVLLGLRAQLRRHGLATWPASVRLGPTGFSIVECAHEAGAQLIVVGLGKHGKIGRLFGAETANRVARRADVPVLAVHSGMRGLARVVVAAVDFGDASNRAVREAMDLMEPGGELHLVHVMSSFIFTPIANSGWRLSYAEGVERCFERLADTLAADTVKTKLLTGDVVEAVTKYARSVGADLIAAGSHNQGIVERILLGSTTAGLLRTSTCSVLVAPPPSPVASATGA
jgi:nucleotide-binding universal stress UspA family protein